MPRHPGSRHARSRGGGGRQGRFEFEDEEEDRNRFVSRLESRNRSRGSSSGGSGRPSQYSRRAPGTGDISMSARRGQGETGSTDAIEQAGRGRGFLQESAGAFAEELMPDLERGLQATRSRFGGGAIRSGGAQEGEERAFERLFSDPLQNRIAQLSGQALSFGAGEAAEGRHQNRFMRRMTQDQEQFNRRQGFRESEASQRRKQERRSGIGSLLGGVAGSLLGPAGSAIGGKLGGFVEDLF